jgi:hypothetical protein
MLRYLVERLPVMVCPKWVLTKSQPIAVDDVVAYLALAIESEETEGKTFDIGGPDVLTYVDMMKRYAGMMGKSIKILILPFLTPRLSSYWIDLVTPISASLARPLIDSLKHEATVKDDSARKIFPIKTKSFEQAIQAAIDESRQSADKINPEQTYNLGKKYLLISLIAVSVLSATHYLNRSTMPDTSWTILHGFWYLGVLAALYFIRKDARLGALIAGMIGWTAFGFFFANSLYLAFYAPVAFPSLAPIEVIRNLSGMAISALIVIVSHALFHGRR